MQGNEQSQDDNSLKNLMEQMNGYDEATGFPKATITYQQYVLEDEKHPEAIRTMTANGLSIDLGIDKYNSDMVRLLIHSKTAMAPEYRILWAAIKRHISFLSNPEYLNKTPILYFLFVSNEQIKNEKSDVIVNIQAVNPFSIHNYADNPQTGNIDTIELLFQKENISYEIANNALYGLTDIKHEMDLQEQEITVK